MQICTNSPRWSVLVKEWLTGFGLVCWELTALAINIWVIYTPCNECLDSHQAAFLLTLCQKLKPRSFAQLCWGENPRIEMDINLLTSGILVGAIPSYCRTMLCASSSFLSTNKCPSSLSVVCRNFDLSSSIMTSQALWIWRFIIALIITVTWPLGSWLAWTLLKHAVFQL